VKKQVVVDGVEPRLLNLQQAARYLGVTTWRMRTLARERKITFETFGGNRWLFDKKRLDLFVDSL